MHISGTFPSVSELSMLIRNNSLTIDQTIACRYLICRTNDEYLKQKPSKFRLRSNPYNL